MKNKIKFFLLFLYLISQQTQGAYPAKDSDFLMLPPFCKARVLHLPGEYEVWNKKLGENFIHVHHFCAGEFTLGLARKASKREDKIKLYREALAELSYMPAHASANFVVMPMDYFDIGQVHQELGNTNEAIDAYQKSIQLNPKFLLPYLEISTIYKSINQTQNAISILEEGLKHKPNSKTLLKRLSKLKAKDK